MYDYTYLYLSPLVIQILMESRRLEIRPTRVNALVCGCVMVVDALLKHFEEGEVLNPNWSKLHIPRDGNFSGKMASKYEEM